MKLAYDRECPTPGVARAGMTLIEILVSVTVGSILVLAMA